MVLDQMADDLCTDNQQQASGGVEMTLTRSKLQTKQWCDKKSRDDPIEVGEEVMMLPAND